MAANYKEMLLVCFNILIGCLTYNYVFANITTVVALMSEGSHIEFFRNYNNIVEKIDNGKVEKETIESASSFFYYVWDRHQGVSFEEVTEFLPSSMSSKLCISLFSKAIDRSLLFCNEDGKCDIPLIISTFERAKFRTYRSSDLVVKIGEPIEDTFILIEGELRVYGC